MDSVHLAESKSPGRDAATLERLSRRRLLRRLGATSLGLFTCPWLESCTRQPQESPVSGSPEAELPTLQQYESFMLDKVYRCRMQPLAWSVATEQSYQAIRTLLAILAHGAVEFAAFDPQNAPWEVRLKSFETHVTALLQELRRQGALAGDELPFNFANPQFNEISALIELLYLRLRDFFSTRGFWVDGLRLMLSVRFASKENNSGITSALGIWGVPNSLYQVSALNPRELYYLHPELRSATLNLVMLRKRDEPKLTVNTSMPSSLSAFAEGQSVIILEDKLEQVSKPIEDLLQLKSEQLSALAPIDFANAVQGRMGFTREADQRLIHVYVRHWPVYKDEDAINFSIIKLAARICARFGQEVGAQLARYDIAAFHAWHEIEHLKYAQGDDDKREMLNRYYLGIDRLDHSEQAKAQEFMMRARLQQEIDADLAALGKAPAGGLLIYLLLELNDRTKTSGTSCKTDSQKKIWRSLFSELLSHPEQYGLRLVPENTEYTTQIRSGTRLRDLPALLDWMREYARASTNMEEELEVAPGAEALWPEAQILAQTYLVAESPERAQRFADAIRQRMNMDSQRDTLVNEIITDKQEPAAP